MNAIGLTLLCLSTLWLLISSSEEAFGGWMFQSEQKWDEQWSKGQWEYMDKVPIERCKIALIGELSKLYSSFNATPSGNPYVLDIGCGEGSLADFLREDQKRFYTGIDVSNS